jgi:hypothetical protein
MNAGGLGWQRFSVILGVEADCAEDRADEGQ